jgi:indole-3-glycerol phosphate synthase/phosphoribosylanthranilate isomerase
VADPAGVLGEIAAAKRIDLERRFAGVEIDALRRRSMPTRRSLTATLARPGARFILEIKKASPSHGAIRTDADPTAIARGYAGVADALSVLTDGAYFGGSLADLEVARSAFDGPILAKDFFIDPRQVVEARIAGADAVLVMLSLLDDPAAREMIAEASRLGMDALVEVHDEAEMRRAIALGAPLIGINNRDLRSLQVDLATTERLAPMAQGRVLVSESGVAGRADVERLSPLVDAFLVGSSLMRAADPAEAARELVFGRVKLCGLNRPEDFDAAAPATFAGFVFAEGTPRFIQLDRAAMLARIAEAKGQKPVGIFRDAPAGSVAAAAMELRLHAVQLHGREDLEYIEALRRTLPESCEIWTAVSVGREALSRDGGDRLLFDNGSGGTGRSFDWAMVAKHPALPQALIAGGIGPANIRAASALGAYAVDVGSSVDRVPGIKSSAKIRSLFEALRPHARAEARLCA